MTRGLAVSSFAQNAELNDRQSTPKYHHHSHQNNYNNKESKLYYKALERRGQTNESYACCRPGLPANENNRQSVVEKWSLETVFWLFYKQRETNTARKGKYKRKTQINTNKCTQTYLYKNIYVCICVYAVDTFTGLCMIFECPKAKPAVNLAK